MKIRDRIQQLRRVKASELQPHPQNWRTHSTAQADALRGTLAEIGWAGAVLVRALPDGSLQLIDGHLRAETCPDEEVPVLVLDLNDEETARLLATFDPLGAMAGADAEQLASLADELTIQNEHLQKLVDDSIRQALEDASAAQAEAEQRATATGPASEAPLPDSFQVVVDCANETQQRQLFERLEGEGFRCRLLTL